MPVCRSPRNRCWRARSSTRDDSPKRSITRTGAPRSTIPGHTWRSWQPGARTPALPACAGPPLPFGSSATPNGPSSVWHRPSLSAKRPDISSASPPPAPTAPTCINSDVTWPRRGSGRRPRAGWRSHRAIGTPPVSRKSSWAGPGRKKARRRRVWTSCTGVGTTRGVGALLDRPYLLALLAEVQIDAGLRDDATNVLGEAFDLARRSRACFYEAEFLRLQAVLADGARGGITAQARSGDRPAARGQAAGATFGSRPGDCARKARRHPRGTASGAAAGARVRG